MSNEIKSVFGILLSEDHLSFLMVKRADIPIWVFPGGGIEKGETAEAACLREFQEETGLNCQIVKKIGDYNQRGIVSVKASVFLLKKVSGAPTITPETRGIDFFQIHSPPKPFLPIFKEFLEQAFDLSLNSAPKLKSVNIRAFFKFFINNPGIVFRFLLTRCGLHLNSK